METHIQELMELERQASEKRMVHAITDAVAELKADIYRLEEKIGTHTHN